MGFFHHWPDFCRAMERPELIEDPRYRTDLARLERRDEVVTLIEEWLQTFPDVPSAVCPYGAIRRAGGSSALCRRNP